MNTLNEQFSDLYGASILPYIEMPSNSSFEQIKEQCNTNTLIGYEHNLKIGDKSVIALFKYTWSGNVAKTKYLHIYHVKDFESKKVITHWREQKNGTFKTI